jgi:hypothetical protein
MDHCILIHVLTGLALLLGHITSEKSVPLGYGQLRPTLALQNEGNMSFETSRTLYPLDAPSYPGRTDSPTEMLWET